MLQTPSSLGQLYTELVFFSIFGPEPFAVLSPLSPNQPKPENALHAASLALFFTLFSSLSFPIFCWPLITHLSLLFGIFPRLSEIYTGIYFLNLPLSIIAVNYWYEQQHIPNNAFCFSHRGSLWHIQLSIFSSRFSSLLSPITCFTSAGWLFASKVLVHLFHSLLFSSLG